MRLAKIVSLATLSAAGLAAAIGGASADTRIFSVQTDRAGVTITAAQRNGQALPETGRSGARTFFEINDGSSTVPCSNQLAFAASNGQRLEYIVDLCAHNWQVTLPLGTAQAPQQPVAPTSLTIYTDDPNVGIDEIYLDKQPMTIAGRQGNAVAIALPPGQSVKCERDLGLALNDGRRIARMVNVCVPNGAIAVALNETATPPPPGPAISVPVPATPPPPPPIASAPPPPFTGTPAVIENLVWAFNADALRATLTYALPNSDQIEFSATCNRGSRQVEISLERSAPEVQPGATVPVAVTAGTFAKTYSATGSDINALTGLSHPEMTISIDDPLWPSLVHGEYLVFQTSSAPTYALSLRGSSAAGRPFIDACGSQSAGFPPPGVPPFPGAQIGGDYPCGEEGTLSSQKSSIETSLTFRNTLSQPIQLFWLDYDGRRRPYQSVGPGEALVQPTFFTHPWVVADLSGRCLSIYYGRRDPTQIDIGP